MHGLLKQAQADEEIDASSEVNCFNRSAISVYNPGYMKCETAKIADGILANLKFQMIKGASHFYRERL